MLSLSIKSMRGAIVALAILFLAHTLAAHAQTNDAVADLVARINRERIARGMTPYALNAQLSAGAQAHAEDLAKTGKIRSPQEGHVGNDGSSVFERVARTGYGAYSWGRRLGENWAHYRDSATAFSEWMDSAPHRNNILHALYREIGIGVAPSSLGGYIFVIDFGAQPNILPIFINDSASETKSTDVMITLSDEQVALNGDGANTIGHPIEIQISNSSDFANAKWQPYAPKINWSLPSGTGKKTVYVKYRDAKNRTATSFDSVMLDTPAAPSLTTTRTITRTPQPTLTLTVTATTTSLPSATMTPTATPTVTPIAIPTQTTTPTMTTSVLASDTSMLGASSAAIGVLGMVTVLAIMAAVIKEMLSR